MEEELNKDRVDPDEVGCIFKLIEKVEHKSFLFDSRDSNHRNRDMITLAWTEIADGIILNNKKVTGDWCKAKWKKLKDYFRSKQRKGKSGSSGQKKPWIYYDAMERVLGSCLETNEHTQSNFDGDDSESSSCLPDDSNTSDDIIEIGQSSTSEVTPTTSKQSNNNCKFLARKRKNFLDDQITSKILKTLEEPQEQHDEYYFQCMAIASKLRRLPTSAADYAVKQINDILYDLLQQYNF